MPRIDILSLYTNDMSFYGDGGNVLVLSRRAELYGFEPVVHFYNPGDDFPERVDVVLAGGGQDSGQSKIFKDLQRKGEDLKKMARAGIPMLVICGMFQLFGRYFLTNSGEKIPGISIFSIHTVAGASRLVGNVVEESEKFGRLVGYENHSGETYFDSAPNPLGKVILGAGNNRRDKIDGAICNNAIGTYLHGPLLAKNPPVADFLLSKAQMNRYGSPSLPQPPSELKKLDALALEASVAASRRPR